MGKCSVFVAVSVEFDDDQSGKFTAVNKYAKGTHRFIETQTVIVRHLFCRKFVEVDYIYIEMDENGTHLVFELAQRLPLRFLGVPLIWNTGYLSIWHCCNTSISTSSIAPTSIL